MIISTIVAMAKNRAIGLDNKMLWHLSDDFKNYKKITTGHTLLMGRKTFESIGRPLPGRTNIVITRNKNYFHEGVFVVHSLEEGINLAKSQGEKECFINGGAEIYRQSQALIQKAYITYVECDIDRADAFFPEIDFSDWRILNSFKHEKDEKNDFPWKFVEYQK